MSDLNKKVNSIFSGKVVRKDLVRKVKVGANVPVYVLEYLLGKYCATDDTSAIDALQDEFHEKVKTGRSLWEMGYTSNQINKRLKLGLPENNWQNTAFKPVQVEVVAGPELKI